MIKYAVISFARWPHRKFKKIRLSNIGFISYNLSIIFRLLNTKFHLLKHLTKFWIKFDNNVKRMMNFVSHAKTPETGVTELCQLPYTSVGYSH